MRSRPRVVAHRGASEDEAEHTLGAYERALSDGADGLECDVRMTRDGVLVCVHDRRVDRTSSGRGVVSALKLADLEAFDFGSWHLTSAYDEGTDGPGDTAETEVVEAPDRDRAGVLTLDRLLGVVTECGRPVELAIETKHPTRNGGLVELGLVELLARHGLNRPRDESQVQVRVMSFSSTSLRRVGRLAPRVPTVYLMQRLPLRLRDGSLPAGAIAGGPSLRALKAHPGYVERAHDAGAEVHVWTVDAPADVDYVAGLGVDVVITNRPRAARLQLEARNGSVPEL